MLTAGDDALQVHYVGVLKLAHDAGLTQEVPPLLLGVAHFQGLNGHGRITFPWKLQPAAADLSELACKKQRPR